jgi:hypothetical protein
VLKGTNFTFAQIGIDPIFVPFHTASRKNVELCKYPVKGLFLELRLHSGKNDFVFVQKHWKPEIFLAKKSSSFGQITATAQKIISD